MFEDRSQEELDSLMKNNVEFRQLYYHHQELDKKVSDAELGVLPIADMELAQMKRDKLAAKERLLEMFKTLTA
ncbi:MAG: YdcH family protein [Pseudomonadota bacterium]|nr:YdcH family protein [Pseudomonadota bacterium]